MSGLSSQVCEMDKMLLFFIEYRFSMSKIATEHNLLYLLLQYTQIIYIPALFHIFTQCISKIQNQPLKGLKND